MSSHPKLTALIVDDEKPARDRLQRLLAPIEAVETNAQAENAKQAMQQIEQAVPDLVFLDISMPEISGIQLAEWIQQKYPQVKIIFTTAYDEYALEAFEVNATDYLLKPIRRERLFKAIKKLFPKETSQQFYVLKDGHCTHKIAIDQIIFLHADQKYTEVHLKNNTYLSSDSLKEFEQTYPQHFLRIHRSTLINPQYLTGIQQQQQTMHVLLENTEFSPEVSRRHQADIRKFLKL
ncbi:MAG: response regulator transcription factor [Gammaproteobacteria bacterium]|nr:response regulator transcription factor [Gammaproteobacteria bacterium]